MAENSPIQAKGVGKNSKRHDLDGTPGLSKGSSVQYGEGQQLAAGQQAVQNTQSAQTAQASGGAGAAPQVQSPPASDPLAMVANKAGGQKGTLPMEGLGMVDTAEFQPMLRRLASGNSSSILKQAYMEMVANASQQPWSGAQTALIDRQALDRSVEQAF